MGQFSWGFFMATLKFLILTFALSFRLSSQSNSSTNQTLSIPAEIPKASSTPVTSEIYYPPTLKDFCKKSLLTHQPKFITSPHDYFIFFDCVSPSSRSLDTAFIIGYLATMIHQYYRNRELWNIADLLRSNNLDDGLKSALAEVLNLKLFKKSSIKDKFNILRDELLATYGSFVYLKSPSELLALKCCFHPKELHKYLSNLNLTFRKYYSKRYSLGDLLDRCRTGRSIFNFYSEYFELLAFPANLILSLAHIMNTNFIGLSSPSDNQLCLINHSYMIAFMYPQVVIDFVPIVKRNYGFWYLPIDNFSTKSLYKDFETFSPFITPLNISFGVDMELNGNQIIIYNRHFKYQEAERKDSNLGDPKEQHKFSQIIIDLSNFTIDKKVSPAEAIFYFSASTQKFYRINSYPFSIRSLENVKDGGLILVKFGSIGNEWQSSANAHKKNPFLFKGFLISSGFLLFEIKNF